MFLNHSLERTILLHSGNPSPSGRGSSPKASKLDFKLFNTLKQTNICPRALRPPKPLCFPRGLRPLDLLLNVSDHKPYRTLYMYNDHSTYMYSDHSTCVHYDPGTCMCYDHSTCMYYDQSTCDMSCMAHVRRDEGCGVQGRKPPRKA